MPLRSPLEDLNLNSLRVFRAVYERASMSLAAKDLHLTQPGVSQHIKNLELGLGAKIFDRIKNQIVPTPFGRELFEASSQALRSLESVALKVKTEKGELQGELRLGLPVEFGVNQVMPLMCEFSKMHPKVRFKTKLDFGTLVEGDLLRGDLDLGIVDEMKLSPKLKSKKLFHENLELCLHESLLPSSGKKDLKLSTYLELPFVEYLDSYALLGRWFLHHFHLEKPRLRVLATVMDVQGIMKLIAGGMGAGIVPGYLVPKLQSEEPKVKVIKGSGVPLSNTLSLVWLEEREHSAAAKAFRDFLVSKFRA